jgi:glyoxylase-like metal-dependent hydrolase (beta-lactamase superfamily II)
MASATGEPFDRDHDPVPGAVETLAPGIRVVTAANRGPMTFTGTRSYLVGAGEVALVDPGPDDPAHRAAILAALRPGERIAAILVTHAHADHSAGAAALAAATGAPVLAHGAPEAGMRPLARDWARAGRLGGGEGIDRAFRPDRRLREGDRIEGEGFALAVLHLPGHLGDHLCFLWEEAGAIFTGDLLMGWSTTLISPPEGDLRAFLASLDRLRARPERLVLPGHGKPLADPAGMIDWQIAHRRARSDQILSALAQGRHTIPAIASAVYRDLDPALLPAAERNVLAHLLALAEDGAVAVEGAPGRSAIFRRL